MTSHFVYHFMTRKLPTNLVPLQSDQDKLISYKRIMNSTMFDTNRGRTSGDGMEEEINVPKQEMNKPLDSATATVKEQLKQHRRPSLHRKDSCTLEENIHSRNMFSPLASEPSTLALPGLHSLYRRPNKASRSLPPVIPKGELVPMKPRLVSIAVNLADHKKAKPPRFIPCEPYPGAVNPIMSQPADDRGLRVIKKGNKNNLDIGLLANQMSNMRTQELDDERQKGERIEGNVGGKELLSLQEELKKVKAERDYLDGQFKFQTKVNAELKNLLVASVGEDLQTRVNVLTEDKLQLARALLDTANNLTTHTEQIEFLAGQCEVWRSKFLASSVMVEELARWKADLTQKNLMLTESSKCLLHTMHQLREMQLDILKNLKFLAKIRYLNLPATDVVSLSAENLNIVQQMVLHSGVGMPQNLNILSASANILSEAEGMATQALDFTSQPLMATDEAIRALFGQVQRPYGRAAGERSESCNMDKIEHTS